MGEKWKNHYKNVFDETILTRFTRMDNVQICAIFALKRAFRLLCVFPPQSVWFTVKWMFRSIFDVVLISGHCALCQFRCYKTILDTKNSTVFHFIATQHSNNKITFPWLHRLNDIPTHKQKPFFFTCTKFRDSVSPSRELKIRRSEPQTLYILQNESHKWALTLYTHWN